LGEDRELLAQGKLDDRLFLANPEESAHAVEKSNREVDQRPHGEAILRDFPRRNESDSRE